MNTVFFIMHEDNRVSKETKPNRNGIGLDEERKKKGGRERERESETSGCYQAA